MWQILFKFLEVIKLSAKPATIIYPYPILPLLIFSHSGIFELLSLLKAIVFSFVFCSGVNLWNHVNDIKEDSLGGKRNIITESQKIRKIVAVISLLHYVTSFCLAIFWSVDLRGVVVFTAAILATWMYSDRILFGRYIGRLKDFYLTEVLAFVVSFPSFILMVWTLFTQLSIKSIAFSVTISLFMLSGTFLKDIRDVTGDKLAGLKTLGVVFGPESLLKTSFLILFLYYVSLIIFTTFGIFPKSTFAAVMFLVGVVYATIRFKSNGWQVTIEEVKTLEVLFYSNIGSLVAIIIAGFI